MGRKKHVETQAQAPGEPQPETQPETHGPGNEPPTIGAVSKFEAVRQAMAEGKQDKQDIIAYALKRFGLDVSEQASQYKSAIKRKQAEENGTARQPRQKATASGPSLADLFKVKEIAGEDVEALAKDVARVEALAEQVGGLAQLKQCLEALVKLQG